MKLQRGNAGIGIFGLLGVIFIVLKVLAIEPVAAWSWWLVLLPIYGGFALVFLVIGITLAFFVAAQGGKR